MEVDIVRLVMRGGTRIDRVNVKRKGSSLKSLSVVSISVVLSESHKADPCQFSEAERGGRLFVRNYNRPRLMSCLFAWPIVLNIDK